MNTENATFGAGCFWGVEAKFMRIPGVKETSVGYMGGKTQKPTYKDVCTGTTGHAEVVHLTFDPTQVSFDQLLDVFFKLHDPTTLDRQGPDVGTQYRSVIFFHDEEQHIIAEKIKTELDKSGAYDKPVVTEICQIGLDTSGVISGSSASLVSGPDSTITGFVDYSAGTWGVSSTTVFFGQEWTASGGSLIKTAGTYSLNTYTGVLSAANSCIVSNDGSMCFTVGANQLAGAINCTIKYAHEIS